jgi:hypothetical protein
MVRKSVFSDTDAFNVVARNIATFKYCRLQIFHNILEFIYFVSNFLSSDSNFKGSPEMTLLPWENAKMGGREEFKKL